MTIGTSHENISGSGPIRSFFSGLGEWRSSVQKYSVFMFFDYISKTVKNLIKILREKDMFHYFVRFSDRL